VRSDVVSACLRKKRLAGRVEAIHAPGDRSELVVDRDLGDPAGDSHRREDRCPLKVAERHLPYGAVGEGGPQLVVSYDLDAG
jgi:hypothetical protein